MYEFTFICTGLEDERAESLLDELDCLIGTDHSGQEFITLLAEGPDAFSAAKAVITQLYCHGVTPLRAQEDLVSRQDIAERLQVTRQAVGQWVRGERGGGDFPLQFNPVCGGIWRWAEVHQWAITTGRLDDDEIIYPTTAAVGAINRYLETGGATRVAFGPDHWMLSVATTWVEQSATPAQRLLVRPDFVFVEDERHGIPLPMGGASQRGRGR